MNIRILPEAERDLELGADFYESQRAGLGRISMTVCRPIMESLRLHAGLHERVFGLHRCVSDRFPFTIFYDFDGNTVDVYAVLDCSQDPDKIESRLSSR